MVMTLKTFRRAILTSVLSAIFFAASASGQAAQNERVITPPMVDYSQPIPPPEKETPVLPAPEKPTTAEKPIVDPGVKPALLEMNEPGAKELPKEPAASSPETKEVKKEAAAQPWGLLTLVTFLLAVSLAANVFLFWQFRDQRKILEELLR